MRRRARAAGPEEQRAPGKCGWKPASPFRAGGALHPRGDRQPRAFCIGSAICSRRCAPRELKGPEPGGTAHRRDKTSPCVRSRHVACGPPGTRQYRPCSWRTPEPGAAAALHRTLHFPAPSPAPARPLLSNGGEFGRGRVVPRPASLRGAALRSAGGCWPCVRSAPAARRRVSSGRCQCAGAMR